MKPEESQQKIESSLEEFTKLAAAIELKGAQAAEIKLQLRTFSTGNSGVRDIRGNQLAPYSDTYKKKRIKAGLQVVNKDLIFSPDTSVIAGNMRIGLKDGKPALGFVNSKGAEIAGYQEDQNKTKIFQLNDSERAEVLKEVRDFAINKIRDITKSWK